MGAKQSSLHRFAVYAPALPGGREEGAADAILFYHPAGERPNDQLNFVGYCTALPAWVGRFVPSAAGEGQTGGTAETHSLQLADRTIALRRCGGPPGSSPTPATTPSAHTTAAISSDGGMSGVWLAVEAAAAVDAALLQGLLRRAEDLLALRVGRALLAQVGSPGAGRRARGEDDGHRRTLLGAWRAALREPCEAWATFLQASLHTTGGGGSTSDAVAYVAPPSPGWGAATPPSAAAAALDFALCCPDGAEEPPALLPAALGDAGGLAVAAAEEAGVSALVLEPSALGVRACGPDLTAHDAAMLRLLLLLERGRDGASASAGRAPPYPRRLSPVHLRGGTVASAAVVAHHAGLLVVTVAPRGADGRGVAAEALAAFGARVAAAVAAIKAPPPPTPAPPPPRAAGMVLWSPACALAAARPGWGSLPPPLLLQAARLMRATHAAEVLLPLPAGPAGAGAASGSRWALVRRYGTEGHASERDADCVVFDSSANLLRYLTASSS